MFMGSFNSIQRHLALLKEEFIHPYALFLISFLYYMYLTVYFFFFDSSFAFSIASNSSLCCSSS